MIWIFYNIIFALVFTLLLPKFLLHMRKRGGYWENFWERVGRYSPATKAQLSEGGRFWVHGVSVGEVFVALEFIKAVRAQNPDVRFVLSTTTSTGNRLAKERIDPRDVVVYFPVDCPFLMGRILKLIRPCALALIETELWPNLIRIASRRGAPLYTINGRMSDSSYRGYSKLRVFTKRLLPRFERIFVQSQTDRERFRSLGAPDEKIAVVGSAKYETAGVPESVAANGRRILSDAGCDAGRTIMLGASTWSGEEELLLDTYTAERQGHSDLFLVLAPRHAERRQEVLEMIRKRGLVAVSRQDMLDQAAETPENPDLLLLDTTGELAGLYPHAALVFVGKSLCAHGGQNPIEPAACGKAVVVGPNMENFRIVMSDLIAGKAIVQVAGADQLRERIGTLLNDPQRRATLGEHALEVVRSQRGAIRRTVESISLCRDCRSRSSRCSPTPDARN